jgi:hypothetical protein
MRKPYNGVDMYHCFSIKVVTARKPHRCIWCAQIIAIGDKYTHEKSIYDGNFQNHHWHGECLKSANNDNDGDYEFLPYSNERPNTQYVDA